MTQKFEFRDNVRVISGFHSGNDGKIINFKDCLYIVRLDHHCNNFPVDIEVMEEDLVCKDKFFIGDRVVAMHVFDESIGPEYLPGTIKTERSIGYRYLVTLDKPLAGNINEMEFHQIKLSHQLLPK